MGIKEVSWREINDLPYAHNPQYMGVKFTSGISNDYLNQMYKEGWEVMQIMPLMKTIQPDTSYLTKAADAYQFKVEYDYLVYFRKRKEQTNLING